MLCLWLLFFLKTIKKISLTIKKNLFIGVSDQVVLISRMLSYIQNPTRVLNSIQGICVLARTIIKSSFPMLGLKYKGNVQKAQQSKSIICTV